MGRGPGGQLKQEETTLSATLKNTHTLAHVKREKRGSETMYEKAGMGWTCRARKKERNVAEGEKLTVHICLQGGRVLRTPRVHTEALSGERFCLFSPPASCLITPVCFLKADKLCVARACYRPRLL